MRTDINKISKTKGKKLVFTAIICILLCMAAIWKGYKEYQMDKNAKNGNPEIEALQQIADTGNFHFQILVHPKFKKGDEEGELMITNPVDNPYHMSVSITLDSSGEEVYSSKVLKPGERIHYDRLAVNLSQGEYPATAMFTVLDEDTQESMGQVAAQITISVEG